MTEEMKAMIDEHAKLAERYSSGFDLEAFSLSRDDEIKVACMFADRINFLFKEAIKCYLGDLWHPASEPPKENVSGLLVVYKDSTCGFVNMNEVKNQRLHLVAKKWIYLSDLCPDGTDEIEPGYNEV